MCCSFFPYEFSRIDLCAGLLTFGLKTYLDWIEGQRPGEPRGRVRGLPVSQEVKLVRKKLSVHSNAECKSDWLRVFQGSGEGEGKMWGSDCESSPRAGAAMPVLGCSSKEFRVKKKCI